MCLLSKLSRHLPYDKRMNPIDFGGQEVKGQGHNWHNGNKLVKAIETTKPLCSSLSNLADMLAIVREWTLLILEVRGQGHNIHIW